MRRATKRLFPLPAPLSSVRGEQVNLNAEMMELLLDISRHFHTMKAYIARCEEAKKAQETYSASSCDRSLLTTSAGGEIISKPVAPERAMDMFEMVRRCWSDD